MRPEVIMVHAWFPEETGKAIVPSGLCEVLVGGSEWVSNPPWTLEVPINGFEVREAHRSLLAPS
jgi:hypothetical protein